MPNKPARETITSECFISDQVKDPDIVVNTKQTKSKRKQKKKKNNSKADISESNRHRCKHNTIDIPHEDYTGNRKINSNEFITFNNETDGITDQPYGIKLISIANNNNPCMW